MLVAVAGYELLRLIVTATPVKPCTRVTTVVLDGTRWIEVQARSEAVLLHGTRRVLAWLVSVTVWTALATAAMLDVLGDPFFTSRWYLAALAVAGLAVPWLLLVACAWRSMRHLRQVGARYVTLRMSPERIAFSRNNTEWSARWEDVEGARPLWRGVLPRRPVLRVYARGLTRCHRMLDGSPLYRHIDYQLSMDIDLTTLAVDTLDLQLALCDYLSNPQVRRELADERALARLAPEQP
ncbi:hypothetical protein M8C13_08800 [Crossiella sp. SN42]|uniref:hypothetical protein n=1 Tax=Crossiella sp. SN42 TaxID=2944808 RepID=UPI00207C7B05|nr:hypothetical protein [Crossiella sp. SN42]MCO1575854.1 hypothetical protein [Crossiella sp. SN42]